METHTDGQCIIRKTQKEIHFLKIAASVAASLLIISVYGWHTLHDQKQVVNYEAMINSSPQVDNPSENVQLDPFKRETNIY